MSFCQPLFSCLHYTNSTEGLDFSNIFIVLVELFGFFFSHLYKKVLHKYFCLQAKNSLVEVRKTNKGKLCGLQK